MGLKTWLCIKKPFDGGTIQERFERQEREAQRAQGKGSGTDSLADEVEAMKHLLPSSGAVVFDVGANKGLWTRELLAQAGRRSLPFMLSSHRTTTMQRWRHSRTIPASGSLRLLLVKSREWQHSIRTRRVPGWRACQSAIWLLSGWT